MNCSTSFFNKAVLLGAFLLLVNPWGCARNEREVSVPPHGKTGKKVETVRQKEAPSLQRGMLITVLPIENLSGTSVPLEDITNSINSELVSRGFRVVDKNTLALFRKKHRMRYIGGVTSDSFRSHVKGSGSDAVLITSLEAYQETDPPQISLIARLVSSGPQPEIIWIDSIGLSGDESPGLLDLQRIRAPRRLLEKAVARLAHSLPAR